MTYAATITLDFTIKQEPITDPERIAHIDRLYENKFFNRPLRRK